MKAIAWRIEKALLVFDRWSIAKAKAMIDVSDIVSFDIFDTLLFRMIDRPDEIFVLTKKLYNKRYGHNLCGFERVRVQAGRFARERSNRSEVTHDEIYMSIKDDFGYTQEECDTLKQIEKEVECDLLYTNDEIAGLVSYCRSMKKRVIITSDMYLPCEFICKMLEINGIIYDALYLSSQFLETKSSGKLFKTVLDREGIRADKLLHIGDNFYSDVYRSRQYGIRALFYRRNKTSGIGLTRGVNDKVLRGGDKNSCWYDFGVRVMGPLCFNFTKWLIQEHKKDGIEFVLFVSRDGYLMKQIYDVFALNMDLPASVYLYSSRKALVCANIDNIDGSSLDRLFTSWGGEDRNLTIKEFLSKYGIDNQYDKIKGVIEKLSIVEDAPLAHVEGMESKIGFLLSEMAELLKENTRENRYKSLRYFEEAGFLMDKKTAFVDIGWKGTMINNLVDILRSNQKDTEVLGYYLFLLDEYDKYNYNRCKQKPFLFASEIPERCFCLTLIENFFSAPHGTVTGYNEECGTIVPILADIEFNEEMIVHMQELRDGAKNYALVACPLDDKYGLIEVDKKAAVEGLWKVISAPTREQAKEFGGLPYYGYKKMSILKSTRRPLHYFLHPAEFVSNFRSSFWRQGFLIRVFGFRSTVCIFHGIFMGIRTMYKKVLKKSYRP